MLPGAVYKDPELSWRYEVGLPVLSSSRQRARDEYLGTVDRSARSFDQVGATVAAFTACG